MSLRRGATTLGSPEPKRARGDDADHDGPLTDGREEEPTQADGEESSQQVTKHAGVKTSQAGSAQTLEKKQEGKQEAQKKRKPPGSGEEEDSESESEFWQRIEPHRLEAVEHKKMCGEAGIKPTTMMYKREDGRWVSATGHWITAKPEKPTTKPPDISPKLLLGDWVPASLDDR